MTRSVGRADAARFTMNFSDMILHNNCSIATKYMQVYIKSDVISLRKQA